ncbi:MAG: biotin--[acetyl-CoA-carboxylase] ligase [Deltaproteobacteria bacterium]|nr:MAG: biotin--[acetyl-CoA-carboxylase] ligase [Deltaproteobacteria bacterium]
MNGEDRITAEGLLGRLSPGGPWSDIVCLGTIESTNGSAMEMAEGGAPHGTVVVADGQTGGRGRMGRRWHSPPGRNIHVSVILRPFLPVAQAPRLSLVAGVALADAVEAAGVPGSLKWPNDLYLGERKGAGILSEMASGAGRVRHVVVGVGINVNLVEDEIPGELRGKATSLRIRAGRTFPRAGILARFLDAFGIRYADFAAGGFPAVRDGWARRDFLAGRRILLRSGGREEWGVAGGVDAEGALLFRRDGEDSSVAVHSGEIAEYSTVTG